MLQLCKSGPESKDTEMLQTNIALSQPPAAFARRILQANGYFSGLSGIGGMIGAGPLTALLGLESQLPLIITGGLLVLYAGMLFMAASQEPVDHRALLLFTVLDSLWVFGSVVELLIGWPAFSTEGKWAVGIVALPVALFADLQFFAWWRSRRSIV